MEEKKFMEKFKELLDTEQEISLDTALKDIEEWDSLSFVSFLAMASSYHSERIEPVKVKTAQTVGDLFALLREDA